MRSVLRFSLALLKIADKAMPVLFERQWTFYSVVSFASAEFAT